MSAEEFMPFPSDYREMYLRLEKEIEGDPSISHDEADPPTSYFRRGELIVHRGDVESFEASRLSRGFQERPVGYGKADEPETRVPLPFAVYGNNTLEASALQRRLAAIRRELPRLRVGLNHVIFGQPNLGCAPGPPMPPTREIPGVPDGDDGAGTLVGVIDTGVWRDHPWFPGHVALLPDSDESARDPLPVMAGHGTFIVGIVRRMAPAARVVVAGPLDDRGTADDASVAAALLAMRDENVKVVSMSCGSYTQDDLPPWGLRSVIETLPRDMALVAAAGNKATSRPLWPAAFKRVFAVGALDDAFGIPAEFTNRGFWVDACAPGVDIVSSFFDYEGAMDAIGDPARTFKFQQYAQWKGTSFSAPQLAAAIAIMMARSPGMAASVAAQQLVVDGRLVPGLGTEFRPNLPPSPPVGTD